MGHYPILTYIAIFSPLIPIVVATLKFNVIDQGMRTLILLLIIGLIVDLLSFWQYQNPPFILLLAHIYVLIEFGLVMLIISSWQKLKILRIFFNIFLGIYVILYLCARLMLESSDWIFYLSVITSDIFIIIGSLYTLYIVVMDSLQPFYNHSRFWILISFVIYYTGTLMPDVLRGFIYNYSKGILLLIWNINWTVSIIANILFTIAFLCPPVQQQTQPQVQALQRNILL